MAVDDNGQTGALGRGPCTAQSCEAAAQRWLQSVDPARAFAPTFVSSSCRPADLGPASSDTLGQIHCRCETAEGAPFLIQATDALPIAPDSCALRGRGGSCIARHYEIPACQPDVPSSCQATCDLIQQRMAEDASKIIDAEVRFAECAQLSPDGENASWGDDAPEGSCRFVAAINGQCYTNDDSGGFLSRTPYDCAEADRDIVLASARAAQPEPVPVSAGDPPAVDSSGWIWNVACPSSLAELCADGGASGRPCVRDWTTASDPATWCAEPNFSDVSIWPPCKGHRVVSLFGSTTSLGPSTFLFYYYDATTGELLHVDSNGVPSVSTCVAGVSGSRYDVFGCEPPTSTTCR